MIADQMQRQYMQNSVSKSFLPRFANFSTYEYVNLKGCHLAISLEHAPYYKRSNLLSEVQFQYDYD